VLEGTEVDPERESGYGHAVECRAVSQALRRRSGVRLPTGTVVSSSTRGVCEIGVLRAMGSIDSGATVCVARWPQRAALCSNYSPSGVIHPVGRLSNGREWSLICLA